MKISKPTFVKVKITLEKARYELTVLHGLLAADGACPEKTWSINNKKLIKKIDLCLYALDMAKIKDMLEV